MPESLTTDNKKKHDQKPPLSVGRIAGEILAGEGVGIAVALPIRYVFGTTDAFQSEFSGFAELSLFIFVLLPVYVLVSAVGVYLVGSIGKQTGSFLATLGFGFLGGIVLFINSFLVFTNTFIIVVESIGLWKYLVLVLLIPPIIATIGFNRTRRYKEPPSV